MPPLSTPDEETLSALDVARHFFFLSFSLEVFRERFRAGGWTAAGLLGSPECWLASSGASARFFDDDDDESEEDSADRPRCSSSS